MAHDPHFIDITDNADLLRLAEEVREIPRRVVLGMGDTPLVAVVPLTNGERHPTHAFAGLAAAAGSWQDEDTDAMLAEIYEDRQRSLFPK